MGLILALLAAFLAFSWRITVKQKLKPSQSDLASTALIDFFAAVTALVFIPLFGLTIPQNFSVIGLLLVSIILSAFGDFLLLFATKHADAADTSILIPLSNVWVLLLAVGILGESFGSAKLIGVMLIVAGSIISLWQKKKFVINRGIVAVFMYGWLITGTILIDKGISNNFSLALYCAIFYFLSSAFLSIISGRNGRRKIKVEWKINGWWNAVVGIQWALFSLVLLYAYSQAEASKVIPLMRMFIVMVTVYSIYVLKERERLKQKIAGSIIVTAGALILAFWG